jgi:hypothetical protein
MSVANRATDALRVPRECPDESALSSHFLPAQVLVRGAMNRHFKVCWSPLTQRRSKAFETDNVRELCFARPLLWISLP